MTSGVVGAGLYLGRPIGDVGGSLGQAVLFTAGAAGGGISSRRLVVDVEVNPRNTRVVCSLGGEANRRATQGGAVLGSCERNGGWCSVRRSVEFLDAVVESVCDV